MTTVSCHRVSKSASEESAAAWEPVANPPGVAVRNGEAFLQIPATAVRGYVNGLPVIGGVQTLKRGDLVRIWNHDGTEASFRVSEITEANEGRCCAFTGEPIRGPAVRCGPCGRLLSQEAVEQTGRCVCGRPLTASGEPAPPEELL
jgi:hypothetical protein